MTKVRAAIIEDEYPAVRLLQNCLTTSARNGKYSLCREASKGPANGCPKTNTPTLFSWIFIYQTETRSG